MNRPVVRAERFEVVDGQGRTRLILGEHPRDSMGLVVLDESGRERARLALVESVGPLVSFMQDGNQAALLGVLDARDPGDMVGGIFMLADHDGVPVYLLRVADLLS